MSGIEFIKCQKCGRIQEKGHIRCIKCRSEELQPYLCEPFGKVITHTTCSALPISLKHHDKVTFAIIELECGEKVLGQVWPAESIEIGSHVRGELKPISMLPNGEEEVGWSFIKQ
ncbi:MAG: Zn-ribbon domain-containing OB-fold protein [Promethearchaeota archaeon]